MARGSRRHMDWSGFTITKTNLGTTQAILGVGLVDVEPVTIARLRGDVIIKGTPNAVADDELVGLGMIVVSDNAAAVGGTSVPLSTPADSDPPTGSFA